MDETEISKKQYASGVLTGLSSLKNVDLSTEEAQEKFFRALEQRDGAFADLTRAKKIEARWLFSTNDPEVRARVTLSFQQLQNTIGEALDRADDELAKADGAITQTRRLSRTLGILGELAGKAALPVDATLFATEAQQATENGSVQEAADATFSFVGGLAAGIVATVAIGVPATLGAGIFAIVGGTAIAIAGSQLLPRIADQVPGLDSLVGQSVIDLLGGTSNIEKARFIQENVQQAIQDIGEDHLAGVALDPEQLTGRSPAELLVEAETDAALRYALDHGHVMVLRNDLSVFHEPANAPENFSGQYLLDRARYVANVVEVAGEGGTGGKPLTSQFIDQDSGAFVGIDPGTTGTRVFFGGEGDDVFSVDVAGGNDRLYGGRGDDVLEGVGGDDRLEGQRGDDILEGDAGFDTYAFQSGDGEDEIFDADGEGELLVDGEALTGTDTEAEAGADGAVWTATDGTTYTLLDGDIADGGTLELTGGALEEGDSITIENFTNGDLGIELDEARELAVSFDGGNPLPGGDSAPAEPTANLSEGGAQAIHLFTDRPAAGGDAIVIELGGGGEDFQWLLPNGERVPGGQAATVALEPGSDRAVVTLLHDGDVDDTRSLTVEASYVDASGTERATADFAIELLGDDEPEDAAEFDHVIVGDREWVDGDPDEPGVQYERTALGNRETNDTVVEGQGDVLEGSAGNDRIEGGGGNDYIPGDFFDGPDGDDLIDAGAGNDRVFSNSGNDVIIGGAGRDILDGDRIQAVGVDGDDRIYADARVSEAEAIEQGNTQPGVAGPGDFLSGMGGDDVLVGARAGDALLGGGGDDRLYAGAGDDYIFGDERAFVRTEHLGDGSFEETTDIGQWGLGFDWSISVDEQQGGEGTTYQVSYSGVVGAEREDAPGDDLVHAGAGADYVDAGAGDDRVHGEAGEDVVFGQSGDDIVFGGADADTLLGDDSDLPVDEMGSDVLHGEGGEDRLFGNGGSDALFGGADADVLQGDASDATSASDYLDGGDGDDVLFGGGDADTLIGGRGNDELQGDIVTESLSGEFHGADFLAGGAGNDHLFGMGGRDVLTGGTGDDVLDGDASAVDAAFHDEDVLRGGDGNDQLFGSGGGDTLYGDADDDVLVGDDSSHSGDYQGRDTLYGGSGSDTLIGAGRSDELFGGTQDDVLIGDGSEVESALHGDDLLNGGDGDDTLYGSGGSDRLIGGQGADELLGEGLGVSAEMDGDDVLIGGAGDDRLVGAGGDDRLDGGADDDTLIGDAGNVAGERHGRDVLNGGDGADTLQGGGGEDRLIGGAGADLLVGDDADLAAEFHGADDLQGGTGEDRIFGGGGADRIFGGTGADILSGGAGGDDVAGGAGDDVIDGDSGDDSLAGGSGEDRIFGDAGNDLVSGGADNDVLFGGSGDDVIDGGSGNDRLSAGPGSDILAGGGGEDVYEVNLLRADGGDVTIRDSGSNTLFLADLASFRRTSGAPAFSFGVGSLKITAPYVEGGTEIHIEGFDRRDPFNAPGIDRIRVNDGGPARSYADLIEEFGFDFSGTDGADELLGTDASDTLDGGAGNDTLIGLDDDDVLIGGTGDDRMEGGGGDDLFHVDSAGDVVVEAPGAGVDRVASRVDRVLSAGVEELELSAGARRGTGNALDNLILGTTEDDVLLGAAGDDRLAGNRGNDVLDGGAGADVTIGGRGDDIHYVDHEDDVVSERSTEGHDTVRSTVSFRLQANTEDLELLGPAAIEGVGNDRDNVLTGNGADNRLDGGRGGDDLFGGAGSDLLINEDGADRLAGGAGDDVYQVHDAATTVVETAGGGHDRVETSLSYVLVDHVEDLTLLGNADLAATGNEQDNTIRGNAGDNRIEGAGGADRLTGGDGDDTYVVEQAGDEVEEAAGTAAGDDTVISFVDRTLAANVEVLDLSLGSAVVGHGNSIANTIHGNAEDNDLAGGAGDDVVFGRSGADVLRGGAGADELEGGSGDDVLEGGGGDDRLQGDAGADRMRGGAANDTYFVDAAGDTAVEQADAGHDTVRSSHDHVLGAHVEDLRLTGYGDLRGEGNAIANGLYGNHGDNQLVGGGGDDVLVGGSGLDHFIGGTGDDRYHVDRSDEVIVEQSGEGTDSVVASDDFALDANVENLRFDTDDDLDGTGNELANHLDGNRGDNRLTGMGGDDRIDAAAGDDDLEGGAGADWLFGGDDEVIEESDYYGGTIRRLASNADTLTGGAGADQLDGGSGDDVLRGGVGDDFLYGGDDGLRLEPEDGGGYGYGYAYGNSEIEGPRMLGNADELYGGAGNDTLDGGSGNDLLIAGEGDDVLYGGDDGLYIEPDDGGGYGYGDGYGYGGAIPAFGNSDELHGGSGNDHLDGGSGNDLLEGGDGDDVLYGGDDGLYTAPDDGGYGYGYGGGAPALGNADRLYGGAGSDTLFGGTDDDLVDGGAGIDHLEGGNGDDVFRVTGFSETVEIPGDGGDDSGGDSGGSSDDDDSDGHRHGNQGVGNGEDPPPPGHDENWNDGPGSGPGRPGARFGNRPHDEHEGHDGHHDRRGDDEGGRGGRHDDNGDCGVACGDYGTFAGHGHPDDTGPDTRRVWTTDTVVEAAGEGHDRVEAAATFVLPEHVEDLTLLGAGDFAGTGNALDNELIGNDGANVLDGRGGADRMVGGAGDDTYHIDGADTIVEYAGGGHDTVVVDPDSAGFVLGEHFERLRLGGQADGDAAGTLRGDELVGNQGRNTLAGLAGDDLLVGGAGNDTLDGGDGDDVYRYGIGDGVDTIEAGAGHDVLALDGPLTADNVVVRELTEGDQSAVALRLVDQFGNELYDTGIRYAGTVDDGAVIDEVRFEDGTTATLADLVARTEHTTGSHRPDWIEGSEADDHVESGRGPDFVQGGPGNDRLEGGRGPDELRGGASDDVVVGGDGPDRLYGNAGFDALVGGDDPDRLYGGCQGDVLLGGGGPDGLHGGGGSDLLAGGRGNDRIVTGGGADVVAFNAGDGHDRVDSNGAERLTVSIGGYDVDELALSRRGDDLVLDAGGLDRDEEHPSDHRNGHGRDQHDDDRHNEHGKRHGHRGHDHHDGGHRHGKNRRRGHGHRGSHYDDHDQADDGNGRSTLVLEDWFGAGATDRPGLTLQLVGESAVSLDPSSGDPLRDDAIRRYDLGGLAENMAADGSHRWQLVERLMDEHLNTSDGEALGGEPARRLALGASSGQVMTDHLSTLTDERFGRTAQSASGTV